MPGAGKTTAFEALKRRTDRDFTGIQMKSVAGAEFEKMQNKGLETFPEQTRKKIREQKLIDQVTPQGSIGEEIADWVDTVLSVDNSYFAEKAADTIADLNTSDTVVVDGIRSVADVECIKRASDELRLVFIHTPFPERLNRLKNRGRSGEEDIGSQYLIDRDRQELSWGVDEILSSYESDGDVYREQYETKFFYASHDSVSEFEEEFILFVDDLLNLTQ